MRHSGPLRTTTAFCLLALLGALGTGLPSHHHAGPSSPLDREVSLTGDHHSHATQLVEQDDRTPSGAPYIAAAATADVELAPPVGPTTELSDAGPLRPTERAPPPGAPRAPPSV